MSKSEVHGVFNLESQHVRPFFMPLYRFQMSYFQKFILLELFYLMSRQGLRYRQLLRSTLF